MAHGTTSTRPVRDGLTRLTIACAVSVAVVVLLGVLDESVQSALRWLDELAPKPGLSGLALLVLSPFAFLFSLYVLEWILNGFGRSLRSDG